jgi:peptide/nickel transport system substrate-binding protein
LTIALSQLPEFFDPRDANPQSKIDLTLMFDHLIGLNADGTDLSKTSGVADSWQSPDQQTWTFHIHPGLTFSNGDPLTSGDVKFSLDRVISPAAKGPFTAYFRSTVSTIDAPASDSVVIQLKKPDFAFPYYLSPLMGPEAMIVPMDYMTKVGLAGFIANPIGSGPYVRSSYSPGLGYTYTYRGKASPLSGVPRYKTIEFQAIPEQGSRVALLQTKAADLVDIDITTLDPATLTKAGYKVYQKAGTNVLGMQLQSQFDSSTALHSEQIRQALALAVNTKELNSTLYRGLGSITGVAFTGSFAYGFKPLTPYPYDPAKAKSLLAQAGYKGTPINVYAFDISGIPGEANAATAVAGYWKAIGVNVNVITVAYSSYRALWFAQKLPNSAGAIGLANTPFELSVFLGQFASTGINSYAKDPNLDALIQAVQNGSASKDAYSAAVTAVNQYIYDHYMTVPLMEIGAFYAGDPKVLPSSWKLGKGEYDFNSAGLIRQ